MDLLNRKRAISFTMAVLMILSLLTPVFAQTATFRDVSTGHFAFEAINWVSDPANGAFMVGDAGNNFHPGRHLNKFEAARIFAMAAGFRHTTHNLPPAEREVFTRSFETHRPFLENMASQFSTWNRTVDREIAFLMYRGIITNADVQTFVNRVGQTENHPLLTRQEAVTWMVRLVGQSAHAQTITLPHPNPFRDDALITPAFRRYIYHAREIGISQGAGGYFNPAGHLTRAEMAVIFHNALANLPETTPIITDGQPATITGTITNVFHDTHVSILSGAGTDTFAVAQNAVVMIDNVQRTVPFLRSGMPVTVLVDANRQIISLVARSEAGPTPGANVGTSTPATAPNLAHLSDEGVVIAITESPMQTVTIRTQRVRVTGQIIDEDRIFTFAQNAAITRGETPAQFTDIQTGDIAFFNFNGSVIQALELMERERTIIGELLEVRPPERQEGTPVLIVEEPGGRAYELRVMPATTFSRDAAENLDWYNLRIGDKITADVEFDRLVRVHAEGERSEAEGRLNTIRISERNTQITITLENGIPTTFYVAPGVFDVYSLRIGMNLRVNLDSREVISLTVRGGNQQTTAILGFIQSINATNTVITVVEGHGVNSRTHSITINNSTEITRGGAILNSAGLRVNMNVYIVQTTAQSGLAQSITVLP
ncbi:MAG: S-layer homology domain-containing protein [Defluviitaleaceae bacterium]|nr:S-layer homology domain-containing protein [Defluviitaleaceae bacterium]